MESIRQRGEHPGHRHHHPRGRGRAHLDDAIRGHREHRRGRARATRGDVRTAVLLMLARQPMHGYQLMQAIADRTGGAWTPSPGAIYPTINQLEDEGLVTVTADAGRKLVALTDAGRNKLAEHRDAWGDPFAGYDSASPGADWRRLVHELIDATRQVNRAGSDAQRHSAAKILTDARRAMYLLLANGDAETDES